MQTRTIKSLSVSVVGLGCNNFGRRLDAERTATVVNAALDAGINFFDTADIYGNGQSEEFLGKALGSRRSQVVVASKFGSPMEGQQAGASAPYIRQAIEASLRRLGTDYIDLYQIHRPDPSVPIAETLGALDALVKSGKVREIGCSNFSVEQIREADAVPQSAHFVSVQNEYSLLKREAEQAVLPECVRTGMAFLPFFPLASGLLSGKYRKDQALPEGTRISTGQQYAHWLTDQNYALVEALIKFAETRGHTILELAFSWLLRWPVVASVIAGATKPEQVRSNVAAAAWQLTDADLAEIESILARVV